MAFINKMDILGANFYNAVEQIKTRLGKNAIVLQLPIGKEDDFKGIIDLMEMEAYIYNDDKGDDITVCEIPDDMKEDAELYHTELIEKICDRVGIIINGKMVLCDTLSHVTAEMPLEDKFFEIYRETAGEIV